jgi:4-diphosphocytidyl-2-C-methyl-D-erythritol kinase
MSVSVFAPAKINLTLEVGRPRADGYHPLQSIVMFADVGDVVAAAPAETLSLSVGGEFGADLDAGENNLVMRAARALAEAANIAQPGAALTLEKSLPLASGMGGGSADAAATLRALNELWKLDWPLVRLQPIARALGADEPV